MRYRVGDVVHLRPWDWNAVAVVVEVIAHGVLYVVRVEAIAGELPPGYDPCWDDAGPGLTVAAPRELRPYRA